MVGTNEEAIVRKRDREYLEDGDDDPRRAPRSQPANDLRGILAAALGLIPDWRRRSTERSMLTRDELLVLSSRLAGGVL